MLNVNYLAMAKELKVLSFNILADVLANGGNFTKLYPNKGHLLTWINRFPQIVNIITSYDPDIFCLAECNHYDQFKEEFHKRGYNSIYSQKDSNNPYRVLQDFEKVVSGDTEFAQTVYENFFDKEWYNSTKTKLGDGVAIFYRESRFVLSVWSLYRSNPVSVHLLLNDTVIGNKVIVTMTHMKSKKKNHEIRMKQIKTIFSRIDDICGSRNAKYIICGDFNADDQEMTPLVVLDKGYKSVYGQKEDSHYTNAKGEHLRRLYFC